MADTKVEDLTADTDPTGDDLLYVVNNPLVSAAPRQVTLANLLDGYLDDATATWTNKRNTKRSVTVTVSATPSINTDNGDIFQVGTSGDLLDLAITSMTTNLSGTPVHGDSLIIEFLDDGTGRAITWGASFRSTDIGTLPTATTASKLLRAGFIYDGTDSIWECVAVSNEA